MSDHRDYLPFFGRDDFYNAGLHAIFVDILYEIFEASELFHSLGNSQSPAHAATDPGSLKSLDLYLTGLNTGTFPPS